MCSFTLRLLLITLFSGKLFLSTFAYAEEKIYIVGVVPQFEARKLTAIWIPILEQLTVETSLKFKLEGAPNINEFEKNFMAGVYDFVYMNPYHFVLGNQLQGYIPLVKDSSKKLQGVLVVKKDSPIENVAQLDGKKIAYPSPNALGASLQMRQELHDIFNIQTTPVYVNTHDSVYINVLLGDTQAGGGIGKTLKKQKKQYQQALRVIHKTTSVSSHPIAAHPRVLSADIEKVTAALINMATTDATLTLLLDIPIQQISIATLADYEPLKNMNLERFYIQPK
ncbi:phosphate/phosphite/phosphonate ABC transporter substrate-binding protein [Moritella sp. Urea-trap-13]|uniref:phosphate/phosphite/phosphonate ABC transporter substrate-binding protein n=1 Tax=Moritella sp. Urea-trap-13 TaxID=2058327 RepID=UPI000C33D7BA|nr:phosphate/phosphite/phosphonate ABC transporter substrate-binding protein [Moritella sp. Urea-trap-13]PKH09329.1 phosphate ABC transporter [Moritella sp. Urea-trap-13]